MSFLSKRLSKSLSNLPKQQGFTLLEVMVALTILSVVAISASQASRSYVSSVGNMKMRTLANFVAQNSIAELKIQQTWTDSVITKQIEAQGQQWQVTITPNNSSVNSNSFASQNNQIKPISVSVTPMTDGQAKNSIVTVESFLLKPVGQR
ncbi:type II secretion system minor pseudopilin GspI [Faucicola mancuniensis]|uniref:type II secretion system minor pseudopilin GspI n=1 Tax=Faucicola mancuniensis TaxID=1309795 RepID=UPI0039778476